jgi:putative holliday junction resolvase
MLTRILSIDYGAKKVGLAISDPLRIIAKPLKTIANDSFDSLVKELNSIIKDYSIDECVIGLPLTLKNTYSVQTHKVEDFINNIKNEFSIKINIVDERLSSIEAKKSLILQGVKTGHNKKDVDMTAAAILLQSYLDNIEK